MPTIVQTFQGRVTGLWGSASMRGADGKMHALKVGDMVHQGDVILTSQDGIVQLSPDDSAAARLAASAASAPAASAAAAGTTPEIDRVITGLDDPNSADATAAGIAGGDGAGDLSPGLRVDRIVESTTPASLSLPGNEPDVRPDLRGGAATTAAEEAPRTPTPIDAASGSISATEEGPAVALGLTAPTGTSAAAVITVTQLPSIGLLEKADGTPVAFGSVLTAAELTGLKYLPPADYDGTAPVGQFTYAVTDRGATANGSVTIALGAINDAPVGNADTASTLEDTPVAGNVLANDRDAEGDALSVTQYTIAGVAHAAGTSTTLLGIGTLVLNANGAYTFTPAADYNGAVPQITYTLTDGTVTRDATLTLAVTPVNDAPTPANDFASTAINAPVTVAVLGNDTDRDGDPLTVTGATLANPAQGTVVVNADGSVTFTPANNIAGPVVVTYTVSDGQGGSATASITVNVGNNSAPTGADAARTTAEDTSYTVKAGDFGFADADAGQSLANVRIDTLPAAGTLLLNGAVVLAGAVISAADIAAGKLVFTPAPDANGAPYTSFTFSVQDNAGAFDTVPNTLTLNVTPVNDAPVAKPDVGTATEDTPLLGNVIGNDTDVDGNVLQVTQFSISGTTYTAGSLATLAGVGTLQINTDGSYTFNPAANYNGAVPVATYTVTDGALTSSSTLAIGITPVNDPPVTADDLASTPINTPVVINVLANDTDVELDPLTVTGALLTNPAQGTIAINPDGTLTFTPAGNVSGPVLITYTVSDGHGGTGTASVTVNVGNNTPPTGADSAHTILEDGSYVVKTADFGFADADAGQTLANVRIDTLPVAGTLLLNGTALSAGALISAADITAGKLVFVPAPDGNGTPYASFGFSVQDSAGAFDTAPNTLTVNVTPVNDAPVAKPDVGSATEDTPLVGNVIGNDTDVDGNVLQVTQFSIGGTTYTAGSLATLAGVGTLQINADGSYTFSPAANYNGAVPVATYTITDGSLTASSTLTIGITGVNDAPVANPDTASATEASGVLNATPGVNPTGNVLTNDADADNGDTKTVTTVAGVVAGTLGTPTPGLYGSLVLSADGGYSYTVDNTSTAVQALRTFGNTLTDTFTYTMKDAAGALSSTTLTVTVHGANDAPVAVADTAAATEDLALTVTAASGVLANDTDVDAGDSRTVSGVAFNGAAGNVGNPISGTYGTLTLNADGSYTYLANRPDAESLAAGQVATEQFSYTVTDAAGAASTATLTITVTGANDAPIANPDTHNAVEDTPLVVDAANGLLANDTDVDAGSALSVTQFVIGGTTYAAGASAALAGVGTLKINGDGSYSFTPAADYTGPVPVATYTVSDGALTSTSTLTLTITPVNDAPRLSLDADQSHNTVVVQPIAGLFNTGESDARTALALGTLDTHYSLVAAPAGSTLTPTSTALPGPWIANDADSTWIGSTGNQPTGVYQYQTSFTLQAGADPASVNLAFDVSSDNNLRDILVNGVSTGFSSNVQYRAFTHVELHGVTSAFGAGVNTITFVVDNRDPGSPGASGPTGLRIDNMTGNVAVIVADAVNHAGDYATTYIEGTPVSIGDIDTSVKDIDSPTLQSAVITLTNAQAGDLLLAGGMPPGIVASINAAGTVVTLTGAASQASYETAIRAVQFNNTTDTPPAAVDRLVTVVVNDGFLNSNTVTTTVHVVPVDDAPKLDLDGNDSTASGTGYAGTYVEKGTGIAIVDTDLAISDTDSTLLRSATIHITNAQAGDVLSAGALPAGITAAVYDPVAGVLTLSGDATLAAYQAALRGITFRNTGASPATVTRDIDISVSDGIANSNVAVSHIAVVAVNDAPAGTDATLTTSEDTPYVLHAADFGFTDPLDTPANALAGVLVNPSSAGTLTLNGATLTAPTFVTAAQLAGDLLQFTPASNANGNAYATLSFQVRDNGGSANGGVDTDASPNTLTFNVTPVNDAPVAVNDAAAATEDVTLTRSAANGVLANDSDADAGDSKTVSAVSFGGSAGTVGSALTGTYGTLTLNADGSYTYLADRPAAEALAAGQTASESFSYTMRDAAGATSTATLTLTITGANDAPVAIADTNTATEDTPLTTTAATGLLANDTDPDAGAALSVTQFTVSGVAGTFAAGSTASIAGVGSLVIKADGSYTFTPAADFNGPVPVVTYTLSDGTATTTSTLTLGVSPVNDAPVAVADTATAAEAGGAANGTPGVNPSGNVLPNDTDVDSADSKTVSAVSGTAPGTVGSPTTGSYGSLVLNADGTYTYSVDNSATAVQALRTATDTLTDTFTYTVRDAAGATSSTTLTVTITGSNDAPVAFVDTGAATEDVTLSKAAATGVLANDTDVDSGDTRTVSAVSFGATAGTVGSALTGTYGTLTLNADGSYTYLANRPAAEALAAGQTATETFSYTVRDAAGATSNASLELTVTGSNDAPVNQVPGAQTVGEDTPLVFSAANGNAITVADVDSASLTVTLSSTNGSLTLGSAAGITVSGNGTGTLTLVGGATAINAALNGTTFKNSGDYNGSAQISVSTSDGTAPAVQSTIGVTVTPVVDITADTASTFESKAVTINVNANDSFENAAHTVTAINGIAIAAGGSVAVANGSVTLQADGQLVFTPTPGYNTGNGAPTSFSYTVSSGGTTETASVDVTVVPVNNAPTPTLAVTPVGRWTFDETTGTTTVDKYNARAGTLSDSTPSPTVLPTFVTGHTGTSGSALRFDGAGSQVALNTATTAPLMGTSSLSFWIKTTQTGSGNSSSWDSPAVIGSEQSGGGNDIQWGALNAGGKIGFGLGNVAGVFSTTSVNDDAWHQVAITRDAVTKLVNVYVDGVFEASGSPNDAAFTATLNRLTGFGANNNFLNDAAGTDLGDNRFLRADLDDVRIYDHVLTANQVAAIRSVEAGYHDLAVANDGDATKITLTAGNYTALSVSGLNAGMVITDGTAGHTVTATGTDSAVDLTGWNLNSISVSGTGTGSALLAFNATDTVNGESHTATQYLNIVNGTSLIAGGTGNDTLNGTANADLLIGNAGNDTLNGGNGNDRLLGGAGIDTIDGGAGNDIIYGGSGNDLLTGGSGADTFAWKLADRGAGGTPATDTVADFNLASSSAGGDSLDLRDLLVGANHVGSNPGNLQSYLDFDTTSAPGSTIVHISSNGGFAGGTYSAAAEDQRIVLQGVDVRSPGAFGLAPSATDNDVIAQLLQRGKLVTDGP